MLKKTFIYRLIISAALLGGCGGDVVRPGGEPAPPSISITSPPSNSEIGTYSTLVRFAWEPSGDNPAFCTRYFWSQVVDTSGDYSPGFDFVSDLNDNPSRYDTLWSEWSCLDGHDGTGWSLVLGDDEQLTAGRYHFLAVQSMGPSGWVDTVFAKNVNVRHFLPRRLNEPYLKVYEPLVGGLRALGSQTALGPVKVPPGTPLRFSWRADPSAYYSELEGYRYGWDIEDLQAWDAPFSRDITSAAEAVFFSGVHTLSVEAADEAGNKTAARIIVEVVPWTMDRDLLWIDDLASADTPIPDYSWPPEYEHDRFWLEICSMAHGFDPARDVYDCAETYIVPGVELLGRYRNVIWTYSYQNADWNDIVSFLPETLISLARPSPSNVISIFLRHGGHVWTLGRSDGGGGLAAVLRYGASAFPVRVDVESAGLDSYDPSGKGSMAWRDYCVTVIDKVSARFRDHSWMPARILDHYDVMRSASLAVDDPVTLATAGLPEDLRLKDEVTAKGSFFSFDSLSSPGGFTYVEVYDPEYWMQSGMIVSRECFHPLYRMRAADGQSAVDGCAVALWITAYQDVPPYGAPGARRAPSVHFGMPLWFFREESVDSIASVIFDLWGIGGG